MPVQTHTNRRVLSLNRRKLSLSAIKHKTFNPIRFHASVAA